MEQYECWKGKSFHVKVSWRTKLTSTLFCICQLVLDHKAVDGGDWLVKDNFLCGNRRKKKPSDSLEPFLLFE